MEKTARFTTHKDLIVYQKAKSLAKDTIRYFSRVRLPRTEDFVVLQLLRAVTSIGANIAEGYGRLYKKSYRQFLAIARGSCFEADYWFEILFESNKFNQKEITDFIERNNELAKMLTAMMKNLNRA